MKIKLPVQGDITNGHVGTFPGAVKRSSPLTDWVLLFNTGVPLGLDICVFPTYIHAKHAARRFTQNRLSTLK